MDSPAPITDDEIKAAPDDVVRATVLALCRNDADLRARVTRVLRVAVGGVAMNEQELPDARRQKPEGLRECVLCEEWYLESENQGEFCWQHPGTCKSYYIFRGTWLISSAVEAECYYKAKAWKNYEEDFGDTDNDTEEKRKLYSEGYIYKCCRGDLSVEGCRWGVHSAIRRPKD